MSWYTYRRGKCKPTYALACAFSAMGAYASWCWTTVVDRQHAFVHALWCWLRLLMQWKRTATFSKSLFYHNRFNRMAYMIALLTKLLLLNT